jgi:hypothetical protein
VSCGIDGVEIWGAGAALSPWGLTLGVSTELARRRTKRFDHFVRTGWVIASSLFIFYFEMSDVQLDKDEIREEKLNNLFRKLF